MRLGDREFSITSCGEDKYMLNLPNLFVSVGDVDLNGVTVIFRLLSVDELKIADRLIPGQGDDESSSGAISAEAEEEIFYKCVHHIFGIKNKDEIELDDLEAGIISTVAGTILKASYDHVSNVQAYIARYSGSITVFDQLKLYVCRAYNMPYKEVSELPVDQLVKKYSFFAVTFPQEAMSFEKPSNDE